ncbi:hypothetical protein [Roseibium aggregatum]|uniref:Uncharacterized protein n=1 Tax=Roseibium aggregatum TaxID=187304 RepID=A0A939J4V8_9HYPH|nr:hypothetical protein [Roseibium aggregatum]MBN9672027.1 hypothetical protein [Roseibium aggregatum]
MKNFWLYFFSLAILVAGVSSANSAEIAVGGDRSLNCIATISGPIATGDAQKLKSFLDDLSGRSNESINGVSLLALQDGNTRARLCLDSPGGSLAEAVRMADLLLKDFGSNYWVNSLGTAVPSGATCASACAVFFMAGGENTESDIGRVADRVLHVNGILGFHSISISLPEANYSRDDVGKAFGLALKSMGAVATRMEALRLRLSLLQTMLATAPEDMYYVETIGDAAHWNIQLAGLPILRQPTPANIHAACSKLSRQLTPEDGSTATNYAHEKVQDGSNGVLQHRLWPENDIRRDAFQSYNQAEDGRIDFVSDGGTELGDIGCRGSYDPSTGELVASVEASNGWTLAVPNAFLYPGGMSLRVILGLAEGGGDLAPDLVIAQKSEAPVDTTCLVFKGENKTDEDPCRKTVVTTLNAGLHSHGIESYQWPSGGKTVVEREEGKVLINGAVAEELWRKTKPKAVAEETDISCLKNSASGNVFCYRRVY